MSGYGPATLVVDTPTLVTVPLRIGLFGGTFDPPHIGHLVVATHVRALAGLDRMVLVVAGDPWQKSGTRRVTPAHHRLEMVRRAAEPYPGLVVDASEVHRRGPSYTIDTVRYLMSEGITFGERGVSPGEGDGELTVAVSLIVGSDAAAGLGTWHRADELRELVDVIVVERPGHRIEVPPGWSFATVSVPQVDVSSSDLRLRLAEGLPVEVLVPPSVVTYLRTVGLYSVHG